MFEKVLVIINQSIMIIRMNNSRRKTAYTIEPIYLAFHIKISVGFFVCPIECVVAMVK